MTARRVLLVAGDGALRDSVSEQLDRHGEFRTDAVADGGGALEAVKGEPYDLVLFDVGLPDLDGRDVCRTMRHAGVKCPIILLTDAGADAVPGPETGADDCVAKPFRMGVLVARMRARLRRREQGEDAVFDIGPYVFRPGARLLTGEDGRREVRLTEKEAAILTYLYRAGPGGVSRETLLAEVWGYNAGVTTHTLETHVYRLRRKIERDPAEARILVTGPGGYRLVT